MATIDFGYTSREKSFVAWSGASTTFTAERLIGSTISDLVPMIAAQFHEVFTAMMFGAVGTGLSLLFALLLPETAGRKFSVIDSKEHG